MLAALNVWELKAEATNTARDVARKLALSVGKAIMDSNVLGGDNRRVNIRPGTTIRPRAQGQE